MNAASDTRGQRQVGDLLLSRAHPAPTGTASDAELGPAHM